MGFAHARPCATRGRSQRSIHPTSLFAERLCPKDSARAGNTCRGRATMDRRDSLRLALGMALALLSGTASAQDWPAKNTTVVVPLGAGSASDVIARVVMEQVAKQIGRTVVVENRPGAGGTTGA